MKANIWEHEKLSLWLADFCLLLLLTAIPGVEETINLSLESLKQPLELKWAGFGRRRSPKTTEKVVEMMNSPEFPHSDDGPLMSPTVI